MSTAILYQEAPPTPVKPTSTLSRKSRHKPMTKPAGAERTQLQLTLRDITILETLYTTRYLTIPQIQALFWRASKGGQAIANLKACQRRMRQLFDHGLVRRIEPLIRYSEGKKPLIYALDKGGAQLLLHELGIEVAEVDYKPQSAESNYPFLQHLLDTTALRIAFTQAAEGVGLHLDLWRNERELKSEGMRNVIVLTDPEGKQYKAAVVPDAVVCLNHSGKQAIFLLEIDRRTVTVEPSQWAKRGWARKVRTYTAYFASDAYQQRYGELVVHVLTVTTGEKRLAHLKQATEQVTASTRFWFTTFDQATDPTHLLIRPIWARAGMVGGQALITPQTA